MLFIVAILLVVFAAFSLVRLTKIPADFVFLCRVHTLEIAQMVYEALKNEKIKFRLKSNVESLFRPGTSIVQHFPLTDVYVHNSDLDRAKVAIAKFRVPKS